MPANPSRRKRPSPEPIDLDEIERDPGFRGMLSFLETTPEDRRRLMDQRNPAFPSTQVLSGITETTPVVSRELESSLTDIDFPSLPKITQLSRLTSKPEATTGAVANMAETTPVVSTSPLTTGVVLPAKHLAPTISTLGQMRRRILYVGDRVQNAHTPLEEQFYKWAWRHAIPVDDDTRNLLLRVPVVAHEMNITDKATRTLIKRMAEKFAIEQCSGWSNGDRQGRYFVVYSYRRILDRRSRLGLTYAIKGGRGIELLTAEKARSLENQRLQASTASLPDFGEDQPESETTGVVTTPVVSTTPIQTTAVITPQTTPVVSGSPSLWSEIQSKREQNSPTTAPQPLTRLLADWITLDDDAVRQIWESCRRGTPDCTPEEVAALARTKLPLIRSGKIDNPAGLLITSIPKFFENGGSMPLKQMRESKRKRREEDEQRANEQREACESMLTNPNVPEDEKEWARQMLSGFKGERS